MRERIGRPERPRFRLGDVEDAHHRSNATQNGSLQCDFEEADVFTVTFEVDFPTNPAPTSPVNCIADILWTTGGVTVKRRVSVGNGVSISGCAESVRVIVTDATVNYLAEVPSKPLEAGDRLLIAGRGARTRSP